MNHPKARSIFFQEHGETYIYKKRAMILEKIAFPATAVLLFLGSFYLYFFSGIQHKADFSIALIGEQRTLDPGLCTTLEESRIVRALFEGLVYLDGRTLKPVPGVARSWEVSADGLVYTFHLRPCLWSDSTPVTAADFVYSWKRVLEPAFISQYDYMLFYLKNGENYRKGLIKDFREVGAEARDDSTLVVTLEHPTAYFLDIAGFETLFPVNRRCVEKYGIAWSRPGHLVTNGAYVLTFHQLNYKMRLEKSKTYWNPARAQFNIIDAYTCEGINTAFNMYETGDVSLVDDIPNIIAEELLKRPDAYNYLCFGTYFYRMNVTVKPFMDVLVRRAFEMAINKEAIVKYVTKSGEAAASTLVPPGIEGYPKVKGVPYNPDSARALLAQAGYPGGKGLGEIELIYNTSENHKKIAEAVAYMLKKELHVNVLPLNVEWKVLLSRQEKNDYTFSRGSWYGDYTDPNTFLDMFVTAGGNNNTGWSNRAYDSLIVKAGRTVDPQSRFGLLAQAEQILVDQGPLINIYYYTAKFLLKKDIRGFYPNLRSYYHLADMYRE
jgi:oligopeptide transport system substrate-binding protein